MLFDSSVTLNVDGLRGAFHSKKWSPEGFDRVINRARFFGVSQYMFPSRGLDDLKINLIFCAKVPGSFTTIGLGPNRAKDPHIEARLVSRRGGLAQK
jgi:Tat protein secretion system quality control protein TatD with DNase activity